MARPVVFRLKHHNTDSSMMKYDSLRGEEYAPVIYPPHVGIPSEDQIYDPRPMIKVNGKWEKNLKQGKPTRIRLAQGESSIFVDEQADDSADRRVKIAFENGVIDVDPDLEPTKLEYLRLTNLNEKPIWVDERDSQIQNNRMKNRQVIFFEVNNKKRAKESLENLEKEADAMYIAKRMKFDEVTRYARVLGMSSKIDEYEPEEVRHKFLGFVKRNPDIFLDMLDNNTEVEIQDIILRAIEEDIIEVITDRREVKWVNGGRIFVSTKGRDIVESFVTYVQHDEDGMEVFEEIEAMVDPESQSIEESVADKREENIVETNKELISTALDAKVIEFEGIGTGFVFGEYKLGKSKSKIIEKYCEDKDFMDALKKKMATLEQQD